MKHVFTNWVIGIEISRFSIYEVIQHAKMERLG